MVQGRSGQRGEVSATDLAKMGYCEKKVLLAFLHGERTTPEQRRSMARGRVAHQQYFEQGVAATKDRRCFIASSVFGPDAAETQVLRAYRDAVLIPRRWGRWMVAVYYSISPVMCWILERSPALSAGMRGLLRGIVQACHKSLVGGSS